MEKRYIIIVLGSYRGIYEDLNHIASSENGVNYVDGSGIFMGTFYSIYSSLDIHDLLLNIPAYLLFDITDPTISIINLPIKYLKGLFPEIENSLKELEEGSTIKEKKKSRRSKKNKEVEEYNTIDDILDKLSRNNYDRNCLILF